MTDSERIALAREAGMDELRNGALMAYPSEVLAFARLVEVRVREEIEGRVIVELTGIDLTATEDEAGWWETSIGIAFGERRLAAVVAAIRDRKD